MEKVDEIKEKKDFRIYINVRIFEVLAAADLNTPDYAIMLLLIRQMMGYSKNVKRGHANYLSGSRIAKLTNFSRPTVLPSLKRLEGYNMIKVEKFTKGNRKTTNLIILNVDYLAWKLPIRNGKLGKRTTKTEDISENNVSNFDVVKTELPPVVNTDFPAYGNYVLPPVVKTDLQIVFKDSSNSYKRRNKYKYNFIKDIDFFVSLPEEKESNTIKPIHNTMVEDTTIPSNITISKQEVVKKQKHSLIENSLNNSNQIELDALDDDDDDYNPLYNPQPKELDYNYSHFSDEEDDPVKKVLTFKPFNGYEGFVSRTVKKNELECNKLIEE